ncbi:oligosaccharide flippase family protein [Prevotella sp. P6B4]|uniref:oligosaccharide flippase family protein n=1 Tax=Prevotella sp. P6B4 TaxID=1410614 RepID=UPI0004913145|nr:oligosaccharide flippase family protein [Prevotella sp. P6B4]
MNQERDEVYSHVLKYTGVFGGVQGLNVLIGLVRNKFVAMLLGPGGMGLVSLFTTTVQLLSQATNLGVSFSAVRHISECYDAGDTERAAHFVRVVRGWCLLTALLGMLLCIVVGPFLSNTTFAWGDHTLHFILLSPAIGMLAITGGETAILKGQRRLGALALVQICSALASLVISIPIYYFFWQAGIVPVIVLMAFVTMCATLRFSLRLYPLQLRGMCGILGEGMEMVRLGVAFTLAGIVGSAAEMVIRSYLNVVGDLDMLGFYNAGYMLTITYAGLVFSAMDTDYYPRLSGVNQDVEATNFTVNRQMEVSLLIVAPMLTALIALLPVFIPQLFTSEFLPVVPMAQVAALAMFFKVLTLPVAYITLARGYSLSYLAFESAYYVALVLLIVIGYEQWGLWGTGLAIALAHAFEFMMIHVYAYKKYGYRMTVTVSQYAFVLFTLGGLAYACTILLTGIVYWVVELLVVLASGLYSLQILRQKTHLWQALTRRFRKS